MLALFFLTLILLQYYLTYRWLRKSNYEFLTLLFIYTSVSYDFIFINAFYYLPGWFITVTKLYNEYLFFYLVFHFWFRLKQRFTITNRADRYVWVLILLPMAMVILLNDFLQNVDYAGTLKGL